MDPLKKISAITPKAAIKNKTSNELRSLIKPSWDEAAEQKMIEDRLGGPSKQVKSNKAETPLHNPFGGLSTDWAFSKNRNTFNEKWENPRASGSCKAKVDAFRSQIRIE